MTSVILLTSQAAGRPWPPPATTDTVVVSGIDDTGATDVTADLQAFIDAVPDGRIIQFGGAGKVYKISQRITLAGRNNLILDGMGATLDNVADANVPVSGWNRYLCSFFFWYPSDTPPSHITIRNFVATAASPNPGHFQAGEHAAFLHAMDGTYLELDNITASGLFGDLVTVNAEAAYVWVHDCHAIDCGRDAISVIVASHVMFEDNVVGATGQCAIDIEPNIVYTGSIDDIVFRNNTIDSTVGTFLSVSGTGSACPISNVVITGNTVGDTLYTDADQHTCRIQNLTFTDNTALSAFAGPIALFWKVDGLTITGNVQPLTAGEFAAWTDCTNVTYDG